MEYIGVNCPPSICATDQLIAPTDAKIKALQIKLLRTVINHMHITKENGLEFVRLDIESVRIVVLSDAPFANAAGLKSQLGFVVLMADSYRRVNVFHYGSASCHQITQLVTAAEVNALVCAFYHGYFV